MKDLTPEQHQCIVDCSLCDLKRESDESADMDGQLIINPDLQETLAILFDILCGIICLSSKNASFLASLFSYFSLVLISDSSHANTGQYPGQQRSIALNDPYIYITILYCPHLNLLKINQCTCRLKCLVKKIHSPSMHRGLLKRKGMEPC
jgi:hypothetical protein